MKHLFIISILLLNIFAAISQTNQAFNIRGVLPWHNFLSGPSAWDEKDYEEYLDTCEKQGINFIGFHNYTGGGERYATYIEPMIKISYRNIVPEACFDNSLTARWGYRPLPVNRYAFETGNKFCLPYGVEAFGSDCSVLANNKNEHYAYSQQLMQQVQQMARSRGIRMAMGFEFGVLPPEYFSQNGFYWLGEANMVPDPTHEISIELHYAAIDNILETYQGIEYIWLWLNEHCFMGVDADKVVSKGRFGTYYTSHVHLFNEIADEKAKFIGVWALKYLQLTQEYLKKKAPEVQIILGGWGGGNQLPALMKGLDKGLSSDIIFSCLNPGLGSHPQPDFLADIAKNRKVWAIPWLEGDHQLWHLQPRVNLMKSHVQLAAEQKLDGVVAIHWRTEDVKLNMETFSMFARRPGSTQTTESIYNDYARNNFGEKGKLLVGDLVRWDIDQLNGGRGLSAEFYTFDTGWGILEEQSYAIRAALSDKTAQVLSQTKDISHRKNLEWLKNTIDFELLLHQVVSAMKPAAELKKSFVENGAPLSRQDILTAGMKLKEAPVEELFTVYANKAKSKGELGVLSSLNQKLWTTYQELVDFVENYPMTSQ